MAVAQWMWADAAGGFFLARLNPLRWSSEKNIKDTVAELKSCKVGDRKRPVILKIWDKETQEKRFPGVDEAIIGLMQVVVFTDKEEQTNTIMEHSAGGLVWDVPKHGKRHVLKLNISTLRIENKTHFSIFGPFGESVVKDPEPDQPQNDLIVRIVKLAFENGVPLEGDGIKTLVNLVKFNASIKDNDGNELTKFTTDQDDYMCSQCSTKFPKGTVLLSCRLSNYHMSIPCAEKKFPKEPKLVRENLSETEMHRLMEVAQSYNQPDLYADAGFVVFRHSGETHMIRKFDDEKMKWTKKRGSNSGSTKDLELLRVELAPKEHLQKEDIFEIDGPFGRVFVDEPRGPARLDTINKMLSIAEKHGVSVVVGKGATEVLGRKSDFDCKVGGELSEQDRAGLSFSFALLKPGIVEALLSSNPHHPVRTWYEKAQKLEKEGHQAQAADSLRHCKIELYNDKREIKAAFSFFDRDGAGSLTMAELSAAAQHLGLPAEDAEVEKMKSEVDADKNGEVSFDEFELWVIKKGGMQKLFTRRHASMRAKGASEDDVLRCALREAGITEASLSFWSPTLPASEKVAVKELTTEQRAAIAHTRAISHHYHRLALPEFISRAATMGYTEKDVYTTLDYLREKADLIVHLELDRDIGSDKLIDKLSKDTHYRNQFETGASGGALSAQTRRRWEHDLFGDAYDKLEGLTAFEVSRYEKLIELKSKGDATFKGGKVSELELLAEKKGQGFFRCKYGVLNTTNDPRGVKRCRAYGDSYLVMKDMRFRSTFSPCDSGGITADHLACCDYYAHVLNEYSDDELDVTMKVGCGLELFSDSNAIGTYKEAQYHGEVALKRHVTCLVVAERHKKQEDIKKKIEDCCKHQGLKLKWMDEYEEEQTKVRQQQRKERESKRRLKFLEVRSGKSWAVAAAALRDHLISDGVRAGQLKCIDAHCEPGKDAILTAFWDTGAEPLSGVPVDLKFAIGVDSADSKKQWSEWYSWAGQECEKVDGGQLISVTGCCGFPKDPKDSKACFVFWDANGKSGTGKVQLKWEEFTDDKSWTTAAKALQDNFSSTTSYANVIGVDAHWDASGRKNCFTLFYNSSTCCSSDVDTKDLAFAYQSGRQSWKDYYDRAVEQIKNAEPLSITTVCFPGNSGVTFAWHWPKLEMSRKRSAKAEESAEGAEAKRPRVDDIAMA